jgi:DNA-directed RNA polymerase subunit RPC12/RpoP
MEFIPVKTFDSYITANIWLGKLQDAGINCYLKDEYTVTIDPILTNAIGGIKLCVDVDQLDQSRELIMAFEHQDRQRLQCPKCKSMNVEYISKPGAKNWLSAISSWLLGSYAVSAGQVYHCFNCGEEFDEIENEELNSIAVPV